MVLKSQHLPNSLEVLGILISSELVSKMLDTHQLYTELCLWVPLSRTNICNMEFILCSGCYLQSLENSLLTVTF